MGDRKIEEKFPVFRVLVIGRANAGMTTLLKQVCESKDDPEIYDALDIKIDLSIVEPSRERGKHDINCELRFKSNPKYRFHDSCGFEAGSLDEMKKVTDFIAQRAAKYTTRDRLHAIWYCIPVTQDRLVTDAERFFFTECKTEDVPVIVVFTKFDVLAREARKMFRDKGYSLEDIKTKALEQAMAEFEKKQLHLITGLPRPPSGHVFLRGMDKTREDCATLIKQTEDALNSETLQQLLISTERNVLHLCARHAIEQ